jgi:hypothetical protein
LAIFLSISPNQTMFCGLFAWSQLDFSAIPVSFSAVSSRRLTITTFILLDFKDAKWAVSPLTHCLNPFQENMCISRFMIQILHNIQTVQEGKDIRKRDFKFLSFQICVVTNLSAPSCFCLCSICFWGDVSNS